MDSKEKKEIGQIVGEAIDQKVTPRLKKIEEQNKNIMEQVAENSEDIEVMKEDISDMKYTAERIETRLDSTMRRQDDLSIKTSQLNRRVLRLESKKAS